MSERGARQAAEWVAVGAVLALLVSIGVYRIPPVDVPWHLATGRLILSTGSFPTTNTFSWTFPEYTLNQQYPLWQVPLALIADHLGWEWVSAWNAVMWALAVLAWVPWVGGRQIREQPLLAWLAVLGVQRHHVPRPEVFTVAGLGLVLWSLDGVRRGDRRFIALGIATTWMMVNGHQMWTLGLALQVSFLVHLALARALPQRLPWVSGADRGVPFAPFLWMLAGSIAVCAVSPLGLRVYLAPFATADTLLSQGLGAEGGAMARELQPVWVDPLAVTLVVVVAAVLVFWVSRSKVEPFELAVVGMGGALVAAAIRGTPFAILAFAAVAMRSRARAGRALPESSPVHLASAAATALLALRLAVYFQSFPVVYQRVQSGLGRSEGAWADDAVAFLRADLPPGPLLNLGWVAGNPLILGLWPERPVFVDPRWEAYPREFLLEAIRAADDRDRLVALLDRWRPGFVVAEVYDDGARRRIGDLAGSGAWRLVYADTLLAVLVSERPEHADYLARHPPLDPASWTPTDLRPDLPILYAQQQVRIADLLRALGQPARAEELVAAARSQSEHPAVAEALESYAEAAP